MTLFPTLFERRSNAPSDDFWYSLPGRPSSAGVAVSEKDALKYLTVFACISLIAGDVARIPLILYRRFPDGRKERVMDHPLYDVLHSAPNPETSSDIYRETTQGHILLWGNKYGIVSRNVTGEIAELWQIDTPGTVNAKRINGRLWYYWKDSDGKDRSMPKTDAAGLCNIFHVPGFGYNGLFGISMISLAREAIGLGLAAEDFGARFFGKGTHPAGVLEMDGFLGENREKFKKSFRSQYEGLGKSHSVMVLEHGLKYKPLTMPLEDAQFLETRDHQKVEICGMYHVPPHKIALHGQNSNYNNLEQENAGYVDSCLMHWLVRWEKAISLQLLTPKERKAGLFAEFLVEGLLRGDSQARAEYYTKMFRIAALNPNQILEKENMNPIKGGDQHFVELNMIPLHQAGEIAEQKAPETEEKASLRDFFAPKAPENRSIIARDRISKQYYRLFKDAAQRIVNKERNAVKNTIKRQRKNRDKSVVEEWLEGFYRDLPAYVKKELGPVFQSFSDAILAESVAEIGQEIDPDEFKTFVAEYTERYAQRHTDASVGQLLALLEGELDDLAIRVDEWSESRPDKIAINETVRSSNAIFQFAAFTLGLGTIWRIRGPSTCPYCKSLNGKKVKRGGDPFVKTGDEIDPKGGDGPMKIRGLKFHPPLHSSCDCYLSIG